MEKRDVWPDELVKQYQSLNLNDTEKTLLKRVCEESWVHFIGVVSQWKHSETKGRELLLDILPSLDLDEEEITRLKDELRISNQKVQSK